MSMNRRDVLRAGGIGFSVLSGACRPQNDQPARALPAPCTPAEAFSANTAPFTVLLQFDGGLVYMFKSNGTQLEIGFLGSHEGQIRRDRGVVISTGPFAKQLAQVRDFFDLKPWKLDIDGGGQLAADGYDCPRPTSKSYPKTQKEWERLCWVPRLDIPAGTTFKEPPPGRGRIALKGGMVTALQPDAYLAQTALWTFQNGSTGCWAQALSDRVAFQAKFQTGNLKFTATKGGGNPEVVEIAPDGGLVQLVVRSGQPDPNEPYGDIKKGSTKLDHLKEYYGLREPKGAECVPKYTDDFPPVTATKGFRARHTAFSEGDPYPGRYCPGMRVVL